MSRTCRDAVGRVAPPWTKKQKDTQSAPPPYSAGARLRQGVDAGAAHLRSRREDLAPCLVRPAVAVLEDMDRDAVDVPSVRPQVVHRGAHRVALLERRGLRAVPEEELRGGVEHHDGAVVEHRPVQLSAANLVDLDLPRLVDVDLVEDALAEVRLHVLVGRVLCGGDVRLASERRPELLVDLLDDLGVAVPLAFDLLRSSIASVLQERRRLVAVPSVHAMPAIQDEAIPVVERRRLRRHISDDDAGLLGPLEVQELDLEDVRLGGVEAGLHATRQVAEAREQSLEALGLLALDLSTLAATAVEEVVKLDGLVRGNAALVGAGLLAQPKVNLTLQPVVGLLHVEHDVRVVHVELAVLLLRPRDDLEVLDSPHPEAGLLAHALPSRLRLRGLLARGLVLVATDLGDVGFLERHAV
eukprot:CAMPEP_0176320400 /NCGR_PEP_ID=MMETSP0121_2-20121125/70806_1 /TAXON_ID=160619 /ORGANISM="Kryptoperidinium foliaceum, Strain CCMP 1326" /LENGTH=412 /DNA_ID=CAMNT_0017662795 /DNA_START=65 /DNA_END=1299 /DNA_ORIENTATION=-